MAKKRFILQGFTRRTHRESVLWCLSCANLKRSLLSIAFINKGGVDLIAGALGVLAAKTSVFAGIRNDITSHQGLQTLLALGVNLYSVDTGARTPLFHPKLFFARGTNEARLLIGSANLTTGGLNNNIEAGVEIALDLGISADKALADEIEAQLDALPGSYPKNVRRVASIGELDALRDSGLLLDEAVAVLRKPAAAGKSPKGDKVPRIRLSVPFLPPTLRAIRKPVKAPGTHRPSVGTVRWEVVWQSKPLTERDLTIPKAAGTHATGSINLDKGLLDASIDHRHYFRDIVFARLKWTHRNSTVDEASAIFGLVVKGVDYGEFTLSVRHTTSTGSTAYKQRNAMTRLSWGEIKPLVALDALRGRTMTLARSTGDLTRFLIDID